MIARLVPYPALATALFVMWLLLAQSISPGQLLLGAAVAIVASRITASIAPQPARVSSWGKVVKLAFVVMVDILRSNMAVAWIVLSRKAKRRSGFIRLDLELRDEVGLAVLALIITATPGTAWVQFDRATGSLLIHVFDLVDEEEWIILLRKRYEALLMDIFER
jgi:multicomponent K+:H+ antiporter subunit E